MTRNNQKIAWSPHILGRLNMCKQCVPGAPPFSHVESTGHWLHAGTCPVFVHWEVLDILHDIFQTHLFILHINQLAYFNERNMKCNYISRTIQCTNTGQVPTPSHYWSDWPGPYLATPLSIQSSYRNKKWLQIGGILGHRINAKISPKAASEKAQTTVSDLSEYWCWSFYRF